MDDRADSFQRFKDRLVPVRGLVYGLRHWPNLHLPVLALAGLRRHSHSLWSGLRDQSRFRNFRVLLQLPSDHPDWPRQGPLPGLNWQCSALPVHLVSDQSVDGAALRADAGHHPCGGVGGFLLLHSP